MDPVVLAFLFGGFSALSLPLGAALGIWTRPSLKVTAAVIAFGAGAAFCALALELVVPAMAHFPENPLAGFTWLSIGAVGGSLIFIGLDHVLSDMGAYLRKASTIPVDEALPIARQIAEAHEHGVMVRRPTLGQ